MTGVLPLTQENAFDLHSMGRVIKHSLRSLGEKEHRTCCKQESLSPSDVNRLTITGRHLIAFLL